MIDLHTHILPGLDDGAGDLDTTLRMCEVACEDGIQSLVATPHTLNGRYENTGSAIGAAVKQLNSILRERHFPLTVFSGAEVHAAPNLVQVLKQDPSLAICSSRYFFLEFPAQFIPPHSDQLIFELLVAGFVPIVTHPERNSQIQSDPRILYRLVEQGALSEITAMSLEGRFGPRAQSCAKKLLQSRLVHFLASDAHSIEERPPRLSKARAILERLLGKQTAVVLTETNPQCVLDDQPLIVPEPVKA